MSLDKLVKKAIKSVKKGNNVLGKGLDGKVYAVDERVVLKLHTGNIRIRDLPRYIWDSSRECAEHELKIGKELYSKKMQVPEYLGLFEPLNKRGLNYWGVFMERIYGVNYHDLKTALLKAEALRQFQEQISLARNLGYIITDSFHDYNSLFDFKKNKLFLFDFVRWERE